MKYRYVAYVRWEDVPRYEAVGWSHPTTQISCPRMFEYGTTMEWSGEIDEVPIPQGEEMNDAG